MVILHLIQKPQRRGAEIFTCQLAWHQKERGHRVKIVSVYKGEGGLDYEDEINYLSHNLEGRFLDFKGWKALRAIIDRFQPDIVQANSGDTLKYAVLSKLVFGWKAPIIFRNASEVGRYLTSRPQKWLNRLFYKNITAVASVSEASKKDLLIHFPFLKGKIQVIPIGVEEISTIPEINLLPNGKKNIVHVGGFTFEKNHKELVEIFFSVLQEVPGCHLHLLGDGPLRQEIEERVQVLDIEDKVSFYGSVTNPLAFIKAADLLVLPSIIEGLPGVILEAMYCKTPVVAYDVGGIAEILTAQTGKLIPTGEKAMFTKACVESLENPEKISIDLAQANILLNYMNSKLTDKFLNFYYKVLTGRL